MLSAYSCCFCRLIGLEWKQNIATRPLNQRWVVVGQSITQERHFMEYMRMKEWTRDAQRKREGKNVPHNNNNNNNRKPQQQTTTRQGKAEQRRAVGRETHGQKQHHRGLSMLVKGTYLLYTHPIFRGFFLMESSPLTWFLISHMSSLSSYLLLRVFFPGGRIFFFSDRCQWNVCLWKIWQQEKGGRGKQHKRLTHTYTRWYGIPTFAHTRICTQSTCFATTRASKINALTLVVCLFHSCSFASQSACVAQASFSFTTSITEHITSSPFVAILVFFHYSKVPVTPPPGGSFFLTVVFR